MSRYQLISESEIEQALKDMPEWIYADSNLKCFLHFDSFSQAIKFMNLVSQECERLNHHPDWRNSFKDVEICLYTHAVGNKVTNLDLELARYCSKAFKEIRA